MAQSRSSKQFGSQTSGWPRSSSTQCLNRPQRRHPANWKTYHSRFRSLTSSTNLAGPSLPTTGGLEPRDQGKAPPISRLADDAEHVLAGSVAVQELVRLHRPLLSRNVSLSSKVGRSRGPTITIRGAPD